MRWILILIVTLVALSGLSVPSLAQTDANQQLNFEPKHRVNAHGNEFNHLARSSDGKRLFVATEKGEIIVWNIALRQAERTLPQPSAVHLVVPLGDVNEILAAGSNHHQPLHALVRKWNVETGTFVDLIGLDESSFPTALAVELNTRLAAVATADGTVVVWDLRTYSEVATWKLNDARRQVWR